MPRMFIIGDSTVEDNKPPFRGWGYGMREWAAEGVEVRNYALSGRSTKSFLEEGLFQPVQEEIGPGDILLIQFGHNDEKDDVERHTDPYTSFLDNLSFFCTTAQQAGALPVLCTPVSRRLWAGDTSLLYTHGEYAGAVRTLATVKYLPLLDLESETRKLYLAMGKEQCAELFVVLKPGEHPDFPNGHDDMTHFNEKGAKTIAGIVAKCMLRDDRCKEYIRHGTV
ncbi:MAG: rhamnogalacturonan acetylesterase [Clostridia bacterium]|nr:rhamnogalacturonan acetylesterase [Clostridia bacterium]